MIHLLIISLLTAFAVAAPIENNPRVYKFASKSNAVEIEPGKSLRITTLDSDGRVTGEQIYPIGQEMVVSADDELCHAELVDGKPREIVTRVALQFGNQFVFLQAVRKRKLLEDQPQPQIAEAPTGIMARIKNRVKPPVDLPPPPGFLDMYYPDPDEFIHGMIEIDRTGDVLNLRINAIHDPQQRLKMTGEELRSPNAFVGVDNELRASRAFRDFPGDRIMVNDVLYNPDVRTRGHRPVRRDDPPRNHTTEHLVPPLEPVVEIPRRQNSPRNGRVRSLLVDNDRTPYQREVRARVDHRVENRIPGVIRSQTAVTQPAQAASVQVPPEDPADATADGAPASRGVGLPPSPFVGH
jgi:hypothetical protein